MRRGTDEGAAAVEFALIAPLLFILLFGIVVFGMGFYTQQGAAAAAREAARRAAVGGITSCYAPYDPNNPDPTNLAYIVADTAPGAYKNSIMWDDNGDGNVDSDAEPTLQVTSDNPADPSSSQTVKVTVPYRIDLGVLTALVPFADNVLHLSTTASAFVDSQVSGSVTSCQSAGGG
jgi:Flp pilus assembly protein TadG